MKSTVIGLSLSIAFLAGCASTPPPRPAAGPSLLSQRTFVGGVPYLPSAAVERQLRGQSRWDADVGVWVLTAATHELRLAPHLSVALLDGAPHQLSQPPVMEQGRLLIPERVWTQWLSRWREGAAPPAVPSKVLRTIILDAGHGGHDPGAISRGGLREKTVTLDIARRLRDLLEQEDFRVVMTRDSDRFVSLSRRSEIANSRDGDLFVSIHANASRQRGVSGFEVYYLSEATDDHARALEAAENAALPSEVGKSVSRETEAIVWDLLYTEHRTESTELAAAICRGLKSEAASSNRGVKSARFAVLKGTRMPAILIEVGFVSNPKEEARLRLSEYRQRLAEGIRRGILHFQDRHEKQFAYAP